MSLVIGSNNFLTVSLLCFFINFNLGAPTIVAGPEKLFVDIDHTVNIQCRTVGLPKPSVIWLKDDHTPIYANGKFSVLPDNTLVIQSKS